MQQEMHFEKGDLTGEISFTVKKGRSLDEIFSRYIGYYNVDRLEGFALRVLLGKENVLTLYAVDHDSDGPASKKEYKVPVKKFKIDQWSLQELFKFFEEINFTVSTKTYPLESVEIVNK